MITSYYHCDYYYRLTVILHFKVFHFSSYFLHYSLIHKCPVEYTSGVIYKGEKWNKNTASFNFIIFPFKKNIIIEQPKR